MKLKAVLDDIQKSYLHMDREGVELALATALTGRQRRIAPIWLFIVNVPSSGKTTITNWINKLTAPDDDTKKLTYRVDDFTPASVQDWVEDASAKCVVVSDMVKLLEAESVTFATLRLLYEQTLVRRTGRGDRDADIVFGFSMVANATHFIDGFFEVEAKLGAIFLKYQAHRMTREEQMECKPPTFKDNERIVKMLQEFVNGLTYKDLNKVTNPLIDDLKLIAYAVEQMRSVLWMEEEVLMVVPEPAQIHRLLFQSDYLARALAWIRGKKKVGLEEIATTGKAMVGTIPSVRLAIISAINRDENGMWIIKQGDRKQDFGAHALSVAMTKKVLRRNLDELEQLRIIGKVRVSKTTVSYLLAPEIIEALELFDRVIPASKQVIAEWSPMDEEMYQQIFKKQTQILSQEDIDDELDDQQKEEIGDDT